MFVFMLYEVTSEQRLNAFSFCLLRITLRLMVIRGCQHPQQYAVVLSRNAYPRLVQVEPLKQTASSISPIYPVNSKVTTKFMRSCVATDHYRMKPISQH